MTAPDRAAFEAVLHEILIGHGVGDALALYDALCSERDAVVEQLEAIQEMQKYSTPSDPTGTRNGLRFQAIERERDTARDQNKVQLDVARVLAKEVAALTAERELIMPLVMLAIEDAERCGCEGTGTDICRAAYRVRAALAPRETP